MTRMDDTGAAPGAEPTAVITGAASGIGAATACAFADAGHRVGLLDRDSERLDAVAAALPHDLVHTVVCDVTDPVSTADAVGDVAQCFGGIDAVVGSAGISGPFGKDVSDISPDQWRRVFDVNVTGQFNLVRAALGHLGRSPDPAIVLVGSDSAFVAAPGMAPYCASKAAVVQFAKALAVDLSDRGIRVNTVCPSITDTPLARGDLSDEAFGDPSLPVQRAEDVARHILYLASPVSKPINAHALVSDFGYLARSSFPA